MGNGDGISKGTIPLEQRVSNRSIINIYVEGQSEMVVFFCGARRLKSIVRSFLLFMRGSRFRQLCHLPS